MRVTHGEQRIGVYPWGKRRDADENNKGQALSTLLDKMDTEWYKDVLHMKVLTITASNALHFSLVAVHLRKRLLKRERKTKNAKAEPPTVEMAAGMNPCIP